MATRLKTVDYAVPMLLTLADNTLTAMTTITAYIPEFSGTVTIRKAIVEVNFNQRSVATTVTQNFTTREVDVSVGGATATKYINSNLYTGSGETTSVFYAADATAHFSSNWTSGTNKTIALSVLVDGSTDATAAATWCNVSATIYITYEYDDTQTTQIKTVYIPLNAPTTTLPISKSTVHDTIPALDTYCPEASKTYRNISVVFQGNVGVATATDATMSMQIDTYTALTTTSEERGGASNFWNRYVWAHQYYNAGGASAGIGMTTNATHSFYMWNSTANYNHPQVFMMVTYEFDASASNNMIVSLVLPMEVDSPMGNNSSANNQRATRDLWIEEPATITMQRAAYYVYWDQISNISQLWMRTGAASYVQYTDAATTLGGSNGAMFRNDSFSLARGRQTANFDIYTTEAQTGDLGWNVSGFWILNYTAGKPSQGYGAANHTVKWNLNATFDGAANVIHDIAATAPIIPETNYFITALGTNYQYISNTTGQPIGVAVMFRDDSDTQWVTAYRDISHTDPETGLRRCWSQIRSNFRRFPGDLDPNRGIDITTARKWRCVLGNACNSFDYLDLYISYHSITFTVGGTISGSAGGTVDIDLHRTVQKEEVLSTTRVGNGTYSFTWYDNTENVYSDAREDGTHLGRSDSGLAT